MAIWKPSALVSAISGTIGGVTFHAGKRSSVLATTRRPTATPRESTYHLTGTYIGPNQTMRNGWLYAMNAWRNGDPNLQKAWSSWAKTMLWPNALALPHHISGRDAWMAYTKLSDPLAGSYSDLLPPPLGLTPRAPAIDTPHWNTTSAVLTVPTWSAPDLFILILTVQQHMEYGTRTSPGTTRYCGPKGYQHASYEWRSQLEAFGVHLTAGEKLRLRYVWKYPTYWPAGPFTIDLTVT